MGSLSAYGEVWGTENYADGSWDDVEGVTPTTEDLDPEGGWANTRIGSIDDQGVMSSYDAEVPFADRSKYSSIPGQNQNEAGEWVDGEPVLKQYDDDGFQIYNTLDKDQMKTAQKSLKVKNKADKKALKLANKQQRAKKRKMWGDTLGQQATNFGNYAFDKVANSKTVAALDMVKDAASIYTDFADAREAERMDNKKFMGMNTVGNLVTPLEANAEGTKGNFDTLTGLLRIDDAVVSELARDGKELYQVGGEPESLTSLRRFTEELPSEIGYNEEDILNQKLSLALMRQGGQLPRFQDVGGVNTQTLVSRDATRADGAATRMFGDRIPNYPYKGINEGTSEFDLSGITMGFVDSEGNPILPSGSSISGDIQKIYTDRSSDNLVSSDTLYHHLPTGGIEYYDPEVKYGGEQVDIDEQLLQELIAAGADIEIL